MGVLGNDGHEQVHPQQLSQVRTQWRTHVVPKHRLIVSLPLQALLPIGFVLKLTHAMGEASNAILSKCRRRQNGVQRVNRLLAQCFCHVLQKKSSPRLLPLVHTISVLGA